MSLRLRLLLMPLVLDRAARLAGPEQVALSVGLVRRARRGGLLARHVAGQLRRLFWRLDRGQSGLNGGRLVRQVADGRHPLLGPLRHVLRRRRGHLWLAGPAWRRLGPGLRLLLRGVGLLGLGHAADLRLVGRRRLSGVLKAVLRLRLVGQGPGGHGQGPGGCQSAVRRWHLGRGGHGLAR